MRERTFECEDTPVRYQSVVSVKALRDIGITDCESYSYETEPEHKYCKTDQDVCNDHRDCCSDYCGYPCSQRGNLPPPPVKRSLRAYRHLDHEADTKPCSGNAECSSYRCINGYCDDKVDEGFAGSQNCIVPSLQVLYTPQLEGEANPGDPSVNNTENTLFLSPGEFKVSFPYHGDPNSHRVLRSK